MARNRNLKNPDEYRGFFISQFATMERQIDIYLASYFIPDNTIRMHKLITTLVDRLNFDSKRSALKLLIDTRDEADFLNGKHGNKKKNHKELLDEIGKLARIRNQFAHYHSVYSKSNTNLAISLAEFRDDLSFRHFTHEKFFEEIERIKTCTDAIKKLRESGLGLY